MSESPNTESISLPLNELVALRRNPQYLTEKQSEALIKSIRVDGFLAPIVVRRKAEKYEILSGNHRVIASREAGLVNIPCILVDPCDDKRAARIAINMNSVHGDPTPELLAPFLAAMDDEVMASVFLDDATIAGLIEFDATLEERLAALELPDSLDRGSSQNVIPNCVCKCGNRHVDVRMNSSRSKPKATSTRASKRS